MRLISQAEFARLQGVSRQTVNRWVKDGIITLLDGKIDPEEAISALERNLDHSRSNRGMNSLQGFSGNALRDFSALTMISFYGYYVDKMAPVMLELFRVLHVSEEDAKYLTVCFAFKTHDLIKEYLERDIFPKMLKREGGDIDEIWAGLVNCPQRQSRPLKHIEMEHPEAILNLLRVKNEPVDIEDEEE